MTKVLILEANIYSYARLEDYHTGEMKNKLIEELRKRMYENIKSVTMEDIRELPIKTEELD